VQIRTGMLDGATILTEISRNSEKVSNLMEKFVHNDFDHLYVPINKIPLGPCSYGIDTIFRIALYMKTP